MKLALRLILCFFIAFSTASAAFAAPSIRDQAIGISKELRDPGAVNQSLYESNAPQAAELKAKIYQLLENGQTNVQKHISCFLPLSVLYFTQGKAGWSLNEHPYGFDRFTKV